MKDFCIKKINNNNKNIYLIRVVFKNMHNLPKILCVKHIVAVKATNSKIINN